jgi:alpha-1,2-mannosyltransferase
MVARGRGPVGVPAGPTGRYTPPMAHRPSGAVVTQPAGRLRSLAARYLFPIVIALHVAIAAAVSVQYCAKILKPRGDGHTNSAILRWKAEFEEMEQGENVHAKYNYPNPPILPQLLTPVFRLIEVNFVAGAMTWFVLKLGMAVVSWLWAFRLVQTPGRAYPWWAKVVAIDACLIPVIGDLKHGNVNLLILFLVMGALYAFSRGKDVPSGLLLALAIASKVTPALFVVYFAWKRAWRVLVGTAVGLVLFFLLVPAAIFAVQDGSVGRGWERNWDALVAWEKGMVEPYLVRGEVTSERENQSLPGVLTRLLSHEPSFSKWVDGVDTPQAYHNLADLDRRTIKRLVQVCQVLFVGLMVWLCRAPVRSQDGPPTAVRHGWRPAAEYSLILVGMLLFSERTWKHHCVTLVLPFAVLSYGAFAGGFSRRGRLAARVSLFTAAAFVLLPTALEAFGSHTLADVGTVEPGARGRLGLNPNSPRELAQVYGAYLWAFLALLVGLGVMLAGDRPRPQAAARTGGAASR